MAKRKRIMPFQIVFNWRPDDVPIVYWRKIRWLRWWTWLSLALMFAYLSQGFIWQSNRVTFILLAILWGASLIFVNVSLVRSRRQLRRIVPEQDYRICTTCGYHLGGLPDRHRCPECGLKYEAGQLVQEWKQWLESYR